MSTVHEMQNKLADLIAPLIAPLGFEVVHLELQLQRQKILRLFIDRLPVDSAQSHQGINPGITVDDCALVSRAIDEPLDQLPEVNQLFHGSYELEVSSPGLDRPLRKEGDFQRFAGQDVRIHTFRPLTAEEIGNAIYAGKNPKQKNFLGVLRGVREGKVLLEVGQPASAKKGRSKKAATTNSVETVMIPFPLISKANIEPKFDMAGEERQLS